MTLFPSMFDSVFSTGIFERAKENGLVTIDTHNFRDWTHDRHHTVDDTVYGGGAGMVLKPQPLFEATEAVIAKIREGGWAGEIPVILLTPQGRPFCQQIAADYSTRKHIILICGEYEGVDERVRVRLATDEISIGDYVLSGGEIPAMVVINTVVRLIPGVLGSEESAPHDSHSNGLLEYPQYTRPADYCGWKVPDVLLSGNHQEIEKWRREQSIIRTAIRRPDLLKKADLTEKEKKFIEDLAKEGKIGPEECGPI